MLKLLISLTLLGVLAGCMTPEENTESRPPLHTPPTQALNSDTSLTALLPQNFDKNKITLLVEKSLYRLTVYYDLKPVKSYKVVLGPDPVSDKRREGDGATPEGQFKIRNLYPHDKWSKFMWVDYPTDESWRRHTAAKAAGMIPADATIGGEIGIHGVPNNNSRLIDQGKNWTAGCVSLKNPDIDELYSVSSKGMNIEIIP